MTDERKEKSLQVIYHYGLENQLKKLNEEVYELSEAILKKDSIAHIIEEYGDVVNLLIQIGLWFHITKEEVLEVYDYKTDRTLSEIKEE